jgi:hypothetical protein
MAEWDPIEAERLIDATSTEIWIRGFEAGPWRVFDAACCDALAAQDMAAVVSACSRYREAMENPTGSWRGRGK